MVTSRKGRRWGLPRGLEGVWKVLMAILLSQTKRSASINYYLYTQSLLCRSGKVKAVKTDLA